LFLCAPSRSHSTQRQALALAPERAQLTHVMLPALLAQPHHQEPQVRPTPPSTTRGGNEDQVIVPDTPTSSSSGGGTNSKQAMVAVLSAMFAFATVGLVLYAVHQHYQVGHPTTLTYVCEGRVCRFREHTCHTTTAAEKFAGARSRSANVPHSVTSMHTQKHMNTCAHPRTQSSSTHRNPLARKHTLRYTFHLTTTFLLAVACTNPLPHSRMYQPLTSLTYVPTPYLTHVAVQAHDANAGLLLQQPLDRVISSFEPAPGA
jgi:hypothetical protein